ncbi:hypothetical protein CASFOL_006788 [Castilleja foliolosa]|uniref:Uncharacterized protein n=1 Tax=Castilleja foliolosa TaxID=1961234 RepID=A0ABD3E7C7_9LAMI
MEFCRPDIRLNVYELKRDYSEWFVKYRVDLSIIYRALDYTKKHGDFDWTMLVRGEKDEDSFMVVVYSGNVIVRYNFVQRNCEMVCDLRDYKEIKFYKGFQYIESLCAI